MEAILRIAATGELLSFGLLISLVFSIVFAIIFFIICSFFQGKISYILSSVMLGLSGLIFSSQLVYYKTFRTFYSSYSAGNATQILQFWKDIWVLVGNNLIYILLFFLPAILIAAFGNKIFFFEKINGLHRGLLVFSIILSYVVGITMIYFDGKEQNSAYDLYFNSSNPILSAEKLGLITTVRLDLQRLLFGWSPVLKASPAYLPVPTPDATEENNDVKKTKENHDEKKVEEVEIEYNTMGIDFVRLISDEENETIKEMHKYFESVQPTAKNKYTGIYKGYNLILITAESFSPYAVRKDVTPTLYKMVHEGFNFTNFYNPLWGVSTSDGEYVALTSLIPKSGVWSFEKSGSIYLPFVMGNQLKKLDYKTVAYHNHFYTYYSRDISHPNMGYDYKAVGHGLKMKRVWPESDLEMLEKTIPEYINNQPFHAYYMTVSGHMYYSFDGNSMALKNQEYVQDLPYSEQGKAYIATQIELDKAMEHLLNKLEEADIADQTLIALSADHYPYGLDYETIDELAGHPVEENFELYKSPFILYTKDMEAVTIDKPMSSLDIIPTLSNLLGLEFDSRLLMGRDIFSDSEPLVIFLNKSFITDKGSYNSITGEFIANEGIEVDENYINWISAIINNKFYYSVKILDTDYYNKVLKDYMLSQNQHKMINEVELK